MEIDLAGNADITNVGTSPFTVHGYKLTLERFSVAQQAWVPFASLGRDADGNVVPSPPALSFTNLWDPQVRAGTTYGSLDRMYGTVINPNAQGYWYYNVRIMVPAASVSTLLDPAQTSAYRIAYSVDTSTTPGTPVYVSHNVDMTSALAGADGVMNSPAVTVTFDPAIGWTPLTGIGSGPLAPGATRSFTGTIPAQPSAPRGAAEPENVYRARLFDAQAFGYFVRGHTTGTVVKGHDPVFDKTIPLGCHEPILNVTKTGPTSAQAGFMTDFGATLLNQGLAPATGFNITDSVDGFPVTSTFTAPAMVNPSQTGTGNVRYRVPLERPAGPISDTIQVTWTDVNGNVYGPLTSSFTTNVVAGLFDGEILLSGADGLPTIIGTTKTMTALVLDPLGEPTPYVPVHFTVTGPNARTADIPTGPDGQATFEYAATNMGQDTIVATATIVTNTVTSNAQQVGWYTATTPPCVGRAAPLDVELVLDASDSMAGPRLLAAEAAAKKFIDSLDPSRDRVGVVAFAIGVSTISQLSSNLAATKTAIDNIYTGPFTNIGAGVDAGMTEVLGPRHRAGATPVMIFLSDGGNSWGDPEPAIAALNASGLRTVAIGVGSDIDGAILRRIASGPADYYYAPSNDDLDWIYGALGQNICRNAPPLVRAGGNQGAYGVRLPHVLTLNGEVHDDGPPGDPRLASEWTVVSGPGSVTFADPSSPVTTALFTDPGTYVLQLAATDGFLEGADRATITVDPEPSLVGASLVTTLGTPGPLAVGTGESLIATLTDSGGHPISDFPVQVTVTGPNAVTATVVTDATGVATFTYAGVKVGVDVLTAVALGTVQVSSTPVSLTWTTAPSNTPALTQGWIGAPTHQSTVVGQVPITVGAGLTLTSGTVTYWPMSAPDQVHTLATGVAGGPGATIATLDTTVLANGSWVIKLDATNNQGESQVSMVAVTVSGDYKPGRVVVEVTDLTIPVAGIPVTLGRRYDSLEKDNVGDFGYGWSLTLGHPKLEVDPAHNVTITMPDNRRVTFYFQAASVTPSITFAWLYGPGYVPEAGTYGTLTADGCPLMVLAGGQLMCFIDSNPTYAPTTYTYTDPYGRVFTMGASGELRSIKDKQQNVLTFTPGGIASNSGLTLAFQRDTQGRITKVTSPVLDLGNGTIVHNYEYSAAGNLDRVLFPDSSKAQYTYSTDHRLLTSKDNNEHIAHTLTYDTAGHLATDTDALQNLTSYAYDLAAHKTTITNPDLGTVEQTFDEKGLLLKEIDPLGRKTEHTYDTNRNELTRKNALGEVTTFTYDANGNQTSKSNVVNGHVEATHITYNQFSQPTTSTDAAGHTTTIEYDEALGVPNRFFDEIGTLATFRSSEHGLPLTVTDAAGKTAYLTYDPYGNMTSRTDRLGRITRYQYDGVGRQTFKTPPRGGTTRTFYSFRGAVTRVDTPTGIFAQSAFGYSYDGNLNMTRRDSDNGRPIDYTYDVLNHLTKVWNLFLNTAVQYTRDFRGNPLTMKDASNRTTTYEYDKAGQLKKTTYPDQSFTTREYDDLGRLVTATDERNHPTTYEYEMGCSCAERVTKVTDPLGHSTTTEYDFVGRRSSVTDASGHTTSYEYDVRGHMTKTTYADTTFELDAYDTRGRHTSHTDQMSSVTGYGYDDEGQLTSVTDAGSHVTHYAYDDDGNLASVTDANNHTTSYDYDLLNRKTKRTLPLGMFETYVYNLFGEATSHTDFRGKSTTMTYDAAGRLLTKVPDPTLAEPTVTLTYYPTGTRASMSDASGVTTYTYDTRNRPLTKASLAGTLTYTYDPAGNVATIRSSNTNGTSVDYAWDDANRLMAVTDNRAGGVTTSAYTATGRPSTLLQPSGVGASYTYDTRDRVTSLAWAQAANLAFGSWSYGFNDRGQHTSVTDVTGRHVAYGYDAVSRLTSETVTNDPQGVSGNGELSYTLDPTGNRLTRTSTLAALGAQSFTYDANDQLANAGYDANGNTISSDGHTYGYDFENRLLSKDSGAVTISYDGDGNRVAKTVGGVTTKYLVDDLNPTGYLQVLEEVSGGAVQVAYTYGSMVVSQRRGPSGAMSYYGYDAHGNVTFLTDATGAVTDSYDYDAWGTVVAGTGTTPNTRLYVGEELDPHLGLINLRARQFKPSAGRFVTLDQIPGKPLLPPSFNRYLYALGDPTNLSDPLGQDAVGFALTLTGAAALVIFPVRVNLGFEERKNSYTTGAAFALAAMVNCAFLYSADWITDKLIMATGGTGDTMPWAPPFQFCNHKIDEDPCAEPNRRCRETAASGKNSGGAWGHSICDDCLRICKGQGSWPAATWEGKACP
jgi:RHS repeat-associated protein